MSQSTTETPKLSKQESHLHQARASLQQALSWYGKFRRHGSHAPDMELQAAVREELKAIKTSLEKIEQKVIRIAAFGLVSRGKSSVVNALLGQSILETGPLNGVTRWPKSVRWTPPGGKVKVELIDTPGLDEIQGEAREAMAQEVAGQADLILFIVAGDITRTEYQALLELRQRGKPLLLVFNKIDLYPEKDRQEIYQQLQQLGSREDGLQQVLSAEEIVLVAAQPKPTRVRVEWPDGKVTQERENPPAQVEELQEKILQVLNQEGRSLLALNALFQTQEAEASIARKTIELRQQEAEEIIWRYAQYKALAVAVNPLAVFDVLGGAIADLALIRSLARLYGLPMTSFEAGRLWRKIIFSSGGLLLGEIATSFLWGLGKTTAVAATAWENPAALATYATAAVTQGGIAGYGAYAVGKAAQSYLEKGCSWGNLGPSTVIAEILAQVEPQTILYRLRQELMG